MAPANGRYVRGRRQIIDDGVQEKLHALVAQRGAAQDRRGQRPQRYAANGLLQLGGADVVALHVADHELVVDLSGPLNEPISAPCGLLCQFCRNFLYDRFFTRVRREVPGSFLDQVDHARKVGLCADGDLDREGPSIESLFDHVDRSPVIGAHPVELIDKADTRHPIVVGLAPDGLRLGLHAMDGIEDNDASIQDAQAALDFDCEVHMAGGVDDVDAVVGPIAGRCGGRDGYTTLAFLDHPVHDGGTFMHFADLVGATGIEKHALGDGGLSGVDMGDDADVSYSLNSVVSCHSSRSLTNRRGRPGLSGRPRRSLPSIMNEGSVRLRHSMGILFLLHR